MTTIPELRTERLLMRAPIPADFPAYAAFFASDRSVHEGGPFDERRAWREFATAVAAWQFHSFGCWSVTDAATGAYLGEVGLNFPVEFPEPEIGWTLMPEAEGRSIAHEAALAARAWFYANTDHKTLVSYIDPANTRSRRLAERLGAVLDPNAASVDPGDCVYRHPGPEALQ